MSAAYLHCPKGEMPADHPVPFYCRGKEGFADVVLARKVAWAGNRRREGRAMCAYRCEHCRLWHVGHNPNRG